MNDMTSFVYRVVVTDNWKTWKVAVVVTRNHEVQSITGSETAAGRLYLDINANHIAGLQGLQVPAV
ncbi:hypothetical protein ColKHC_01361 [Colletotrichum higginsianum]|nr:hypothetical protein ColKHC_01361 [Colletotrichum higginsianum]